MKWWHAFSGKALILSCGLLAGTQLIAPLAAEQDTSSGANVNDLLAVQVREQGNSCDKPESAEQLKEQSQPDVEVWILKCENATYRVKLIPDMAAEIARIE